jgi:hypothetical protein
VDNGRPGGGSRHSAVVSDHAAFAWTGCRLPACGSGLGVGGIYTMEEMQIEDDRDPLEEL